MAASERTIEIVAVDHIGIRVRDLERAMSFYRILGFELEHKAKNDAVAVLRNRHGVELNLVYNANADAGGNNILMDVGEKYPGYTHVALRVASIKSVIEVLRARDVPADDSQFDTGCFPRGFGLRPEMASNAAESVRHIGGTGRACFLWRWRRWQRRAAALLSGASDSHECKCTGIRHGR